METFTRSHLNDPTNVRFALFEKTNSLLLAALDEKAKPHLFVECGEDSRFVPFGEDELGPQVLSSQSLETTVPDTTWEQLIVEDKAAISTLRQIGVTLRGFITRARDCIVACHLLDLRDELTALLQAPPPPQTAEIKTEPQPQQPEEPAAPPPQSPEEPVASPLPPQPEEPAAPSPPPQVEPTVPETPIAVETPASVATETEHDTQPISSSMDTSSDEAVAASVAPPPEEKKDTKPTRKRGRSKALASSKKTKKQKTAPHDIEEQLKTEGKSYLCYQPAASSAKPPGKGIHEWISEEDVKSQKFAGLPNEFRDSLSEMSTSHPIQVDGVAYATPRHCFEACKFLKEASTFAAQFSATCKNTFCRNPQHAKQIGGKTGRITGTSIRRPKDVHMDKEFDSHAARRDVMLAMYAQYPESARILVATNGAVLLRNSRGKPLRVDDVLMGVRDKLLADGAKTT